MSTPPPLFWNSNIFVWLLTHVHWVNEWFILKMTFSLGKAEVRNLYSATCYTQRNIQSDYYKAMSITEIFE